jgi:hypothetical protein
MPGARAIASSDPILTNFAAGIAPELRSPMARRLSPFVVVNATNGHFKRYDDKNAFTLYETARAMGGDRARIEFNASDDRYDCKPQSLATTLDDDELDAAGSQDILGLRQAKIRTLLTAAARGHEKKVFDKILTAKAAVANKGDWTNPEVDPVQEVDEQIVAIAKDSGYMPSDIIMSITAWQAFRLHPKVVARQPGAEIIGLTTIQAAMLFIQPGIQITIGAMPYDQVKTGKAQSNEFIGLNEVLIFYNSPTADQYDPSFSKTFTSKPGGITGAGAGRIPTKRYDEIWVDWDEDIQVVSTKLGRRITVEL